MLLWLGPNFSSQPELDCDAPGVDLSEQDIAPNTKNSHSHRANVLFMVIIHRGLVKKVIPPSITSPF